MEKSVLDILNEREAARQAPRIVKLDDARLTLLNPTPPKIDRAALTATGIISTSSPDRSRDVVITKGIFTQNHRVNPVVLLEHGLQCKTPIGKAADRHSGLYTVELFDDYAVGTTHFSQNSREAEQTFALIDEGVLKGLSIGFKPIKASRRPFEESSWSGPGLLLEEVELLEYSHVVIPDNPECIVAVDSVLSKGRICGAPLSEVIVKSISPYASPKRIVVQGATLPAADGKSIQPHERMNKDDAIGERYVPMPQDSPDGTGDSPTAKMKPGAQALTMAHDKLIEACDDIESAASQQENEKVASRLESCCEAIEKITQEIADDFKDIYPELDPLQDKPADDPSAPDKITKDDGDDDEDDEIDGMAKGITTPVTPPVTATTPGTPTPDTARQRMQKRLAAYKVKRDALQQKHVAEMLKRMSKGHCYVVHKAADFLEELSGHEGSLLHAHRTAAETHSSNLRAIAKEAKEKPEPMSGTQATEEMEGLKALLAHKEAELVMLREKIPVLAKHVKSLTKELDKLRKGE